MKSEDGVALVLFVLSVVGIIAGLAALARMDLSQIAPLRDPIPVGGQGPGE